MYSEIILGLRQLTYLQAIWGTAIGVAAVIMIVAWLTYACRDVDRSTGKCRMIVAIIATILLPICIAMTSIITTQKEFFVMVTVAPHIDAYIQANPESVFDPSGAMTTVDNVLNLIQEALQKSIDLIPTR